MANLSTGTTINGNEVLHTGNSATADAATVDGLPAGSLVSSPYIIGDANVTTDWSIVSVGLSETIVNGETFRIEAELSATVGGSLYIKVNYGSISGHRAQGSRWYGSSVLHFGSGSSYIGYLEAGNSYLIIEGSVAGDVLSVNSELASRNPTTYTRHSSTVQIDGIASISSIQLETTLGGSGSTSHILIKKYL